MKTLLFNIINTSISADNDGMIWSWITDRLPEGTVQFLEKDFYHNTTFEWFLALTTILIAIFLAKIVYWFVGRYLKKITAKTKSKMDDLLVDMLEEPMVFGIIIIGLWWGIEILTFPDGIQHFISNVFHILIALDVTWMLARTVDALVVEYLVPLVEKSENDLDDQLMPILRKGIRSLIWIMGIIVGLNNAGYHVGALLAGLGIGGLAMAMAAKDFVANIFGGITVFIDKPFTINDRIQVGGYDGVVTEIGIRSTRMKTLAGRMITIPNHKFTDSYVENVSAEPSRKVSISLGLTYDTPPEDLEKGIAILKDIVAQTDVLEDNCFVGFNNFGDFALGIKFIYYIKKGADIMDSNNLVHLKILKAFNDAKLDFAFPTQTILASVEKTTA